MVENTGFPAILQILVRLPILSPSVIVAFGNILWSFSVYAHIDRVKHVDCMVCLCLYVNVFIDYMFLCHSSIPIEVKTTYLIC